MDHNNSSGNSNLAHNSIVESKPAPNGPQIRGGTNGKELSTQHVLDCASPTLEDVDVATAKLEARYKDFLKVDPALTRQLVSFQANKKRANYRWYKYKEGFSAALMEHLFGRYGISAGVVFDPFAGSGTTLFAANARGLDAHGIELLPIGVEVIETRRLLEKSTSQDSIRSLSTKISQHHWADFPSTEVLNEMRITAGAYPSDTVDLMQRYLSWANTQTPFETQVLRLALLCVLEQISYTRKDGQYLRWDHRSGRKQGATRFDKGVIHNFNDAVSAKLLEILGDVGQVATPDDLFPDPIGHGDMKLEVGSSLHIMPKMKANAFDAIVTSPPYCNRYDYTRTYALELALLGVNAAGLAALRQEMLSCTVENRAKDLVAMNPEWTNAIAAADHQHALQTLLAYLENMRSIGKLNNSGIPRMVRGYFYELACIIADCARVLKKGAPLIMVNDNVRYAGASVPVDLILSDIAVSLGFIVEEILVLPTGKGNSSQQMGAHGRDALRKCVYVWRKA